MGIHSPAPWTKKEIAIYDGEGNEVKVHGLPVAHTSKDSKRTVANGNLMAAAGDLYEALKKSCENALAIGTCNGLYCKGCYCHKAIRKAEEGE